MQDFSLYIHYPFCLSKCPYCDFNSYKLNDIAYNENFINAYLLELDNYYKLLSQRKIKTIFFGGGTPSLMSIDFLSKIMKKIDCLWGIDRGIEVSMEANPTTVEIGKFQDFKTLGINRLSIGIQSLNDDYLKFFGRIHNAEDGLKAINIAQKVFVDKYSIDLIYARPKQKLKEWVKELKDAIKLSPNHISLYQLIIEEGTKFYENNIGTMQDNKASRYYNITNEILEENGIFMYEVSNYSKHNYECQHNINYWENGEWLGIGAGAHSRMCFDNNYINNYKIRITIENEKKPDLWIKNVFTKGFGYEIKEEISKDEFIEETLLMGLRMKNGINLQQLQKYLQLDSFYDIYDNFNLNLLQKENIIDLNQNNLKVKQKYFNVLNSIIEKLV